MSRARWHRQRAREQYGVPDWRNTLTQRQVDGIIARGECVYCSTTGGPFTIEHVRALSDGGANSILDSTGNAQVVCCCAGCNSKKGSRDGASIGMHVQPTEQAGLPGVRLWRAQWE